MNQEMTNVPEYRLVQNAPSKNSERAAYDNGFMKGYNEGIEEGLMQAKDAIDIQLRRLRDDRQNQPRITTDSPSSSSGSGNCS